jgi:hypothetical protein
MYQARNSPCAVASKATGSDDKILSSGASGFVTYKSLSISQDVNAKIEMKNKVKFLKILFIVFCFFKI